MLALATTESEMPPWLGGVLVVLGIILTAGLLTLIGAVMTVEPYMGMAAHVIVSSHDHRVLAHLHPSGSISMAALERFTAADPVDHSRHASAVEGRVEVPYAFPKAGRYRMWVQVKRAGGRRRPLSTWTFSSS